MLSELLKRYSLDVLVNMDSSCNLLVMSLIYIVTSLIVCGSVWVLLEYNNLNIKFPSADVDLFAVGNFNEEINKRTSFS